MNWAKKLLQKDDESFTHPSHDCPRCGDRLRDDGDRLVCDQCGYPDYEDDDETDDVTCDVCGEVLGLEYPTCPVCGVALCGSERCANEHIAEHHPEWNDEDDEDDEDDVCAVCGEVLASGHPTCPCCAAPLCGDKGCYDAHMAEHRREWRGEDTDDEPSGRCDDCERDGNCERCPGYPGYTKPNPF